MLRCKGRIGRASGGGGGGGGEGGGGGRARCGGVGMAAAATRVQLHTLAEIQKTRVVKSCQTFQRSSFGKFLIKLSSLSLSLSLLKAAVLVP